VIIFLRNIKLQFFKLDLILTKKFFYVLIIGRYITFAFLEHEIIFIYD